MVRRVILDDESDEEADAVGTAEAEDGVTAEAGEVQEEVVGQEAAAAQATAPAPPADDDDDDDIFVDEEPKPGR